jgi:hypothetical protein
VRICSKIQTGCSISRRVDGVTFFAKAVLEGFDEARFVFDDKDFGIHGG